MRLVAKPGSEAAGAILLEKGCALRDQDSCYRLGEYFESGPESTKDVGKALGLFERLCDAADVRSCVHLGAIYKEARDGIARDDVRANNLYERACAMKSAGACTVLGYFLLNGNGIKKDLSRAANLFAEAATTGHSGAQTLLGGMYADGNGVKKDVSKAVDLFKRSCAQDDPVACQLLGGTLISADAKVNLEPALLALDKACKLGQKDSCEFADRTRGYQEREGAVDALELWRAYDANELAADEQFKGKRFMVRGVIQAITKDIGGNAVIELRSPNQFMSTHLGLAEEELSKAVTLRKGNEVYATCVGRGSMLGSPMLDGCKLQL